MSISKKVFLSIIILILAVFTYFNISTAATYNNFQPGDVASHDYQVGDTITGVRYQDYLSDPDLYCIEHDQRLTDRYDMTYKVVSRIVLEGNRSTDHTGRTIENSANAKFAYILSENNGPDKEAGQVQNSVWNYIFTWMQNVGQHHAGLSMSMVNNKPGTTSNLDNASSIYEGQLQNLNITDNTNKENITVTSENRDGTQYIKVGPFNWNFPETLSQVQVYEDNNVINGIQFINSDGNWSSSNNNIASGRDFYIAFPANSGVSKITRITAVGQKEIKRVTITFWESQNGHRFQNLMTRKVETTNYDFDANFDYDIDIKGNLKVIKVNKDNHEIKLQGVGFKIQNKATGQYIHQDANGNISYVDEANATEYITDSNGEIQINGLIVGTYVAYETKNPNYGYEIITGGIEQEVVVDKTQEMTIENDQIYIRLSGYVWRDIQSGKQSLRNDLYLDDENDDADILMEGVIVRLKDRTTGETIMEATTDANGAYEFTDVLIDKLGDYYIEFEYDGLTYTNVLPNIDKDNGSKAAESATEREEFNNGFSVIEGATADKGVALDQNGNVAHELSYNRDTAGHTSTLINEGLPVGQFPINANTDETGYSIISHYTPGIEEIENINLGLYEREQPDLAIMKDMQNVRLSINGYEHVYEYAQRFVNQGDYDGTGFNVGVKFSDEYQDMSYTRAIYQADYEYENENDRSKELQVFITYRISLRNQSTNLASRVNSIVDYYDSRYTLVGIGTGVSQGGTITGNINYTENGEYNSDYSRITIDVDTMLNAQSQSDIYVQFQLSREAVINILNDGEMLKNVTEITSYSTFDTNGNIYAGVDLDSNPSNATPGDSSTYEDDTDSSPALKLEVADAREMTGKVFLDSTSGELMTGQIRQGSGQYEEGETGISGVTVTLTENTGSGQVYTATTDENGDFLITGFIPGDYTLTYTWGDETYTVQNYKGTVYSQDRYATNTANKEWYKTDVATRWTDAVDNYDQEQEAPKGSRLQIDAEMNTITSDQTFTRTQMDSTTPTMGIGVEYETTTTASSGDRYTYRIENIDFGIVERARQDIGLDKRVSTMRVTLANGQTLVDLTVAEDGTLEGQTSNVIYMPPSPNTIPRNGFIRLEMDSELIQGSTLTVGYELVASNNSELDYMSEEYYKYGIQTGDVVTITPSAIVDYLDSEWGFVPSENSGWEAVTLGQANEGDNRTVLVNGDGEEIILADDVTGESSTINEKTILYTEQLSDSPLAPGESEAISLNVSKLLSSSEDISLDNEAEIVKVDKPGGSDITSTPGNYVPGTGPQVESDDDMAETVLITPNTGANLNYVTFIALGLTTLIIVGTGVVFIKKKVLNK